MEIVQAVREGRADIGVVMDGVDRSGLASFIYRKDRLVAVVPRGHEVRARKVPFAELLRYDLVGLDGTAAMMRLLGSAATRAEQPLRLRIQVKSFEAVCKLVQAGMGIGMLPEVAARDFAPIMGLRLVALTDDWADRIMFVCACATTTRCPPFHGSSSSCWSVRRAFANSETGRDQMPRVLALTRHYTSRNKRGGAGDG